MTTERLDRIETDLEDVKDILMSAARYAETANERISQLAITVDRDHSELRVRLNELANQVERDRAQQNEQITQLGNHINSLTAAVELNRAETDARVEALDRRLDEFIFQSQRLINNFAQQTQQQGFRVERLEQIARMLTDADRRQSDRMEAFERTVLAHLERQERIMDYLLRRDGDRPNEGGNPPQPSE